jgi:hypothetical protein
LLHRTKATTAALLEFYGAEDLAAKLLDLSKAMANGWTDFARMVEEEGRPRGAC